MRSGSIIGRASLVALAAMGWLGAAAPAPAAVPPPKGIVDQGKGVWRHQGTRLLIPATIDGLRRVATTPGNPAVSIYMPTVSGADSRTLVIGVGNGERPLPNGMRDQLRRENARGGAPEILAEESFAWPGHPGAETFHGSYAAGEVRKEYWSAWDRGYSVLIVLTAARSAREQMAQLSATVAREVFGGAGAATQPAK
jgi:hypothetical protein